MHRYEQQQRNGSTFHGLSRFVQIGHELVPKQSCSSEQPNKNVIDCEYVLKFSVLLILAIYLPFILILCSYT